MNKLLLTICMLTWSNVGIAQANIIARQIAEGLEPLQAHWITIAPKSKEECLKETGGEINNMYAKCRNGWQEMIQIDSQGKKRVLSERAIQITVPK